MAAFEGSSTSIYNNLMNRYGLGTSSYRLGSGNHFKAGLSSFFTLSIEAQEAIIIEQLRVQ
ncbi:hypothetical protein ACTXT7_005168 [Hymenolepis weldensis]